MATTTNPYLTFNGTCEAAFNFYQSVFGGEFPYAGKFKDMPDDPNFPISEEDKEKIMHVSLPIGEGTILMGSDSSEAFGHTTTVGNNISLSINTDNEAEAIRIFEALSADGTVKMPLEKTFWGALFGQFTDKFGIHWMVNYEYPRHKEFEEEHQK